MRISSGHTARERYAHTSYHSGYVKTESRVHLSQGCRYISVRQPGGHCGTESLEILQQGILPGHILPGHRPGFPAGGGGGQLPVDEGQVEGTLALRVGKAGQQSGGGQALRPDRQAVCGGATGTQSLVYPLSLPGEGLPHQGEAGTQQESFLFKPGNKVKFTRTDNDKC